MALTRRSIATLLDLVEIKLSCMEVVDREDHREVKTLRACREELMQMLQGQSARMLSGQTMASPGTQPSAA